MKKNNIIDDRKEKIYLTQSEVAERFRTSESTIKNWRDRGYLSYFQVPGSTRVIYPCNEIEEIERQYTSPRKEVDKKSKRTEISRREPDVSSRPQKEWRI